MSNFKTKDNLVKQSAIISIVVLFGKILGFVKQAVIAWAFGANGLTDVYYAADGYTSMYGEIMRTSVAPTVLTRYIKLNEEGQYEKGKDLIQECFLLFGIVGSILVVVNVLLAPAISDVIGLSYSSDQKRDLIFYLRALCPVMLFTSISGVAQGYLDANKRFIHAKLCSFFFSLSIILCVLFFKDFIGLKSLLYGFLFGYALHTVYMVSLVVIRTGIHLNNPFKGNNFRAVIKSFIPLVIGSSVVDFGHLVDRIVASSLAEGSVSALYYGQVISNDIVNAVIITSIGTVLLTSLTKSVAVDTDKGMIRTRIRKIMCIITIISGYLSGVYYLEGKDIILLFFERGSFNTDNTKMVSSVAAFYAAGFIFMANREVLIKTHYAFQNTFTPMINSIIGVFFNLVASICLSRILGVSGVALATSLSMIIVSIISYVTVKKHIGSFPLDIEGILDIIKIICALILSVLFCKLFLLSLSLGHAFFRLMIACTVLLVLYITLLILFHTHVLIDNGLPYVKQFLSGTEKNGR